MNKLAAAIYMTAQGIPFIHAGEEFLREKVDANGKRIENSYNAPDYVNQIRWNLLDCEKNAAVTEYYRGLIRFRKSHPALRLSTAEAVADNVTYRWITNELVLFEIKGKDAVPEETAEDILVVFNATAEQKAVDLTAFGIPAGDWDVCINDHAAGVTTLETVTDGKLELEPISAMVLVKNNKA